MLPGPWKRTPKSRRRVIDGRYPVWEHGCAITHSACRQAWGLFICTATSMSKKQHILVCALSALCLILAVEEQRLARDGRSWQNQVAVLQARMEGSLQNRLGPQKIDALFQDLANASLKNRQVRQWLAEHGINVSYKTPPSGK